MKILLCSSTLMYNMKVPTLDSSVNEWIEYANLANNPNNGLTDEYCLTDDQKEIIKLTNSRRIYMFQSYVQNRWRLDKTFRDTLNEDYRSGAKRYKELVESSLLNYLIESGIEPKRNYNTRNFIEQVNRGHVVETGDE